MLHNNIASNTKTITAKLYGNDRVKTTPTPTPAIIPTNINPKANYSNQRRIATRAIILKAKNSRRRIQHQINKAMPPQAI
ncbi:hypothetical protein BOTNAR_0054g00070 [Botryotinia narcissicola]|uniref:Uncharacterized protein n=1 Tax=Botryotinia narcissicola TaxID=278944 RepID=A0A4Z1IZG9_9HELO|nr:hypothetical protein BOTNAR_0054g00070 [Botryotinia narcissicola]